MDYLDSFSAFAAGLSFDELPATVRKHAGWILADTLAAIVAGAAEPELRSWAALQPSGPATLVGLGQQTQPVLAALVNGTAGTFLEMDEGNRFARGHPAVHVLPSILALAQERRSDTQSFLSALVAGYEVGSRLGAASQLRGSMHPHGTWGTVGAAAACARLLGRDAAAMRETLNVASSMTIATSKRTMLEGGLVRNVYAGLSNQNGYLAAQLAGCGFTGERDGLRSLFGAIVSESFDTGKLMDGLGTDWHLAHNYFKLHSCCRYNHGTLDALDALQSREGLPAPQDIERIEVVSYSLAAELDDTAPRNTLAAKFSVPFAVATRLVHGSSGLASFTWDAVRNEEVQALARKVSITEDPAMTKRLPHERPARITILDRGGRRWVGEAGVNRGDDAAPYTPAELEAKFLELTQRAWPAAHCHEVLDATHALCAGQVSMEAWFLLLRQAPAR
ncbi:MmgE/PrpD family protein [Ramlibacter sp. G-1-2-2]|uniref:MmgE/PrpD family protein n=1 Tax=Ramlibacter agri TaxID=2728837 RepID=A0A848HDA2_9BURK|nr:MmgE/PrpD family protein [Ramlibacter agri]NML48735.1 MmgE/PrpD family protein [Ramlibacter agri]